MTIPGLLLEVQSFDGLNKDDTKERKKYKSHGKHKFQTIVSEVLPFRGET